MPAVRLYVINLKSAEERWRKIAAGAADAGLEIARIDAVDGNACPVSEWKGFDRGAFARWHGRRPLAGEYGCYRSHVAALEAFLADGGEWALIGEDDIEFEPDFASRADALTRCVSGADLINLHSFRRAGFFTYAETGFGDAVGRAAFGPQGSSACYAVSRSGAKKILLGLQRCFLPLDVAMERGWALGTENFSVKANLATLGKVAKHSQIGSTGAYGRTKPAAYRRLQAFGFRAAEFYRRLEYALQFR